MNNLHVLSLSCVLLALMGCAAKGPPALVSAPEPPAEWKISVEKRVGCPEAAGEFELIPKVADLQKNGVWLFSDGEWYDFILLIPSSRVKANKWTPSEPLTEYSRSSFSIESEADGDVLRITTPDKNGNYFLTKVFRAAENDFSCESGELVFPEFKVHGGTEGAFLSVRIHRHATKTLSGDLLFYEQVRGFKTVHKYYLFKMKSRIDSSG